MKFRLTYQGPLPATQGDSRRGQSVPNAVQKHIIRENFHHQLKDLWDTNPSLISWKIEKQNHMRQWRYDPLYQGENIINAGSPERPIYVRADEALADQFSRLGFRFVPLVWEEINLICSIDVLFLRRGRPGRLFSEGDVDNRIKTLIDCLRMPRNKNEIPNEAEKFDPFYVLLEDDKYLSKFSVETDDLHDPLDDNYRDATKAQLIISVELKPWRVSVMNLHFS